MPIRAPRAPHAHHVHDASCRPCSHVAIRWYHTGATTRLFDPNTRKPSTFTFDHSYWSHDGYVADENGYLRPADEEYADQQKVYDDLGEPTQTVETTRAALRERAQRGERRGVDLT